MSAPVVAVSPDGKKTALAWMDKRSDGNDPNVYWSISNAEAPLADETRGTQNHPQVAFDKSGAAYAVWEDERSGECRVFGSTGKGKNVALSSGEGRFPSIACGGGVVAVVYEAGDRVEFAEFK